MLLYERLKEINYKIECLESIYLEAKEGSITEETISYKLEDLENYINKIEDVLNSIDIENL